MEKRYTKNCQSRITLWLYYLNHHKQYSCCLVTYKKWLTISITRVIFILFVLNLLFGIRILDWMDAYIIINKKFFWLNLSLRHHFILAFCTVWWKLCILFTWKCELLVMMKINAEVHTHTYSWRMNGRKNILSKWESRV